MIRHQKGHKNSKGEKAEWVIVSHKDGRIISSHSSKAAAEKHLKDIQKFKHMKESVEDGHISKWDRNKIFKGIAPKWAKKVTTVGPKAKRPDTANIPSELAMRRVTEPNYRKYTELDLRNDKEADKIANQRIADMIARKVDLPMAVTADSIIIHGDDTSFEVIPYGFVYKIRVRKGLEKEIVDFESISEVIEFIKKETLGESMKLDEAKEILKKNGAKVIKESKYSENEMNSTIDSIERIIYAFKHGEIDFEVTMNEIYDKISLYCDNEDEYEDE